MRPERWEEINLVYYAALEGEAKERASFPEGACGGDTALRSEVESLPNMHAQADGFLGKSVMQGSLPND